MPPTRSRTPAFVLTIALLAALLLAMGLVLGSLGTAQAAPDAGPTCFAEYTGDDVTDFSSTNADAVQAAVDAAPDGGTVKLAGTCPGVQSRGGFTQTVYISKSVTVRGGYTHTNWLTAANPVAWPTTLDALGQGRVVYIAGTISPTLEGLRLTGGDGTGLHEVGYPDLGGGVYVYQATVAISGCAIYNNIASTADYGYGGGVTTHEATATISDCAIYSNTASTSPSEYGIGGGLFVYGSTATISGCAIYSNTAGTSTLDGSGGGGIFVTGSYATLQGNTVQGNIAGTAGPGYGGGLFLGWSEVTLQGNKVHSNTASLADIGYGGGIYLEENDATLQDNTIEGNTASIANTGYGGGLFLDGNATLQGNTVANNVASTGGEGHGGGLSLRYTNAILQGNTIMSNTASTANWGYGGGLSLAYSSATLQGNEVLSNTASSASGAHGGGLYLSSSPAVLQNNTIRGNTASAATEGAGGGLSLAASDATLEGNTIINNAASSADGGIGGGLYLYSSSASLLTNTLQSNIASTAGEGHGGGLFLNESPATLRNNEIRDNTASAAGQGHGGGLYLYFSAVMIQRNTVASNTASTTNQGYGGGLYLSDSQATLQGNTIVSNTATLSPTALGLGGGVYVRELTSFTLTNDLVAANQATTAGDGLWVGSDYPSPRLPSGRLRHTTIADNGTNGGSGQGVCLGPHATLALTNTIVAGHSSVGITVTVNSTATLEGTLWYNNGTESGGGGTFISGTVTVYGDPAFAGGGDYHLIAGSAAIDVGVDAGVVTDIDGDLRPLGLGYDIGADEFLDLTPIADAGPDQTASTNATATLDGSGSRDPGGALPLSYLWTQTGGPAVTLSDPGVVSPTFTAPPDPAVLTFTLIVTNNLGLPGHTPDEVVVLITNPPIANAGDDQTVSTLALVTLDGSGSNDPDGDLPLSYRWTQSGGPTVTLSSPMAISPTFSAPPDPAVLTFTLMVTDSLGLPALTADEVVITVTNQPPTANAGGDQVVATLAPVMLDGSGSSDPDGDLPLDYLWSQIGGPTVTLSSLAAISPTFSAPPDPAVLTFTLMVTDSLGLPAVTSDEVVVTITNQPPTANAGGDQVVATLDPVMLDGSGSSDPDGDLPLDYLWMQTGGPAVTLSDPTAVSPTFTAPPDLTVLTFTLIVTDRLGLAALTPDEVVVTVGAYHVYLPLVARNH